MLQRSMHASRAALAVMLGLVVVMMAAPAMSQVACGAREVVLGVLVERHGEAPRLRAVTAGAALAEFYANSENGNWSFIVTTGEGVTCVIAVGNGWELDAAPPKPSGKPS